LDFETYSNLQSLANPDLSKVVGHEISDLSALLLQADVALRRKGKGYGYGYGGHQWKGGERKYGHLFKE
jgi:hypothetical protein